MQNHVLTAVELVKHRHGRGAAAEVIPDAVLRQQTLGVDAISGATYSSKVILKAIDDALGSARQQRPFVAPRGSRFSPR